MGRGTYEGSVDDGPAEDLCRCAVRVDSSAVPLSCGAFFVILLASPCTQTKANVCLVVFYLKITHTYLHIHIYIQRYVLQYIYICTKVKFCFLFCVLLGAPWCFVCDVI